MSAVWPERNLLLFTGTQACLYIDPSVTRVFWKIVFWFPWPHPRERGNNPVIKLCTQPCKSKDRSRSSRLALVRYWPQGGFIGNNQFLLFCILLAATKIQWPKYLNKKDSTSEMISIHPASGHQYAVHLFRTKPPSKHLPF